MEEILLKYALISNNIVQNIIVCDDPAKLEVYQDQYDHIVLLDTEEGNKWCGVGADWDSANGIFFYPPPPPVYDISKEEFRNRFTKEEKLALYAQAKVDIETQVFLDDLNSSSSINVQNEEIIDSINHLVSVSVIEQSRVEEILKPN